MPKSNEELNSMIDAEKQKKADAVNAEVREKEKANERQVAFETAILNVLRNNNGEGELWFTFLEIREQVFANRVGTYIGKAEQMEILLLDTLNFLVKSGKIKEKIVESVPYYSGG